MRAAITARPGAQKQKNDTSTDGAFWKINTRHQQKTWYVDYIYTRGHDYMNEMIFSIDSFLREQA